VEEIKLDKKKKTNAEETEEKAKEQFVEDRLSALIEEGKKRGKLSARSCCSTSWRT
jgi:hypothetical protein